MRHILFKQFCEELEAKIEQAADSSIGLEDAEKLASQFTLGLIRVGEELTRADLNSRMRRSGVKAIKAAIYTEACSKAEKKPTESALEHMLNMHSLVTGEQEALDKAEVERDSLERYFSTFREALILYRGISRGRMD